MQKGMSVYIPQPCHEDWNKMNPAEKGKFCNACAKQVVDFTDMSDRQILDFFSKANTKVCGRFAGDQLQRPLQPIVTQKKKAWWVAALMPLLLLFDKADAQKNKPVITIADTLRIDQPDEILVGKVAIESVPQFIVEGRVIDNSGNPVPFATITFGQKFISVSADSLGMFSIKTPGIYDSADFIISAIGYETQDINIKLSDVNFITVVLQQNEVLLGDIVVTSSNMISCSRMMGGIAIIKKVSAGDTIPTLIRKVFSSAAFKIFPNPAIKGTDISIELKNKGTFTIQLLDNASKLLVVKEANTSHESALTSLSIPSTIASGTYYIRVIDEKKKKQYTDKIIIQ